jgi:hypothetical protein
MPAPPTRELSPLRRVGSLLARLPFNTTTRLEIHGVHYLKKQRRAYAPMLVLLANWYAARLGLMMRMLPGPAWFGYEQLLYDVLHGRHAPASGKRALLLPRLPGRNLLDLLQRDPSLSGEGRMGLELAASELARLHACRTPRPLGGGRRQFSHADATIRNALVDVERRQAVWIDFETAHTHGLPAQVRHADDLLTLLSTAAAIIQPAELPALCQTVLSNYGSSVVAGAMWDLVQSWDARPLARRLAFPDLEDGRWHALCEDTARLGLQTGISV